MRNYPCSWAYQESTYILWRNCRPLSHKIPIINILMKELRLEQDWDILVVQKRQKSMKCHYCHAIFQKTNNNNQSPLEEFIMVWSLINVLIALLTFRCKLHDKYYHSIKVHTSEAHIIWNSSFQTPFYVAKVIARICTIMILIY